MSTTTAIAAAENESQLKFPIERSGSPFLIKSKWSHENILN